MTEKAKEAERQQEDQGELDIDQVERNTSELGKIILGLSTAGIGLLKFRAADLSFFEQLSASSFLFSIVSLFFAYLFGSHVGIKMIENDDKRDNWIYRLNNTCNFFFILGLSFLTLSIWE